MQAIVTTALGTPEVLKLQDIPKPTAGAGEILIEVHASAMNTIDTKLRRFGRAGLVTPPYVGGYDVSGVVVALGEGVNQFKVGDEVYASPALNKPGAHAEFVAVDARTAALKPRSISHQQAAALPLVTLTAWESLHRRANIRAGQNILITAGAGGVGHIAIQLAKIAGLEVYATAGSDRSIKACEDLGADEVINYKQEDFTQAILNETQGKGVEIILDCVGGETFEKCPDAVAVNGQIVAIVPGPPPASLAKLYPKNVSLHFEFMGAATVSNANPAMQGEVLREVAGLVDAGKLRPLIFKTYPLAETAAAHAQQ